MHFSFDLKSITTKFLYEAGISTGDHIAAPAVDMQLHYNATYYTDSNGSKPSTYVASLGVVGGNISHADVISLFQFIRLSIFDT